MSDIVIIIIIIVVIYFFFIDNKEGFQNLISLQSENNKEIQSNVVGPELVHQNNQHEQLQNYSQLVAEQNNDLTYYHNDVIDQSKITQTPYDIINQHNKINYYDVETGIEKCNKSCSGVCWEYGWTGSATCYPSDNTNYGTFYKNPAFINSLNPNPQQEVIYNK